MLTSTILLFSTIFAVATVYGIGHQQWMLNISESTTNDFYYYWNQCVGSGHGELLLYAMIGHNL